MMVHSLAFLLTVLYTLCLRAILGIVILIDCILCRCNVLLMLVLSNLRTCNP
jgi:hypothetical protein